MGDGENKSKKFKSSTDKPETDHNYAILSIKHELCGSAGAGTSAMTGSREAVAVNRNSAPRNPEQMVFLIPHLLESILSACERPALLNCRLVSRRWAYFGAKELQKTVTIKFRKSNEAPTEAKYKKCKPYTLESCKPPGNRPIKDLIALMKKSSEFPCTSFDLDFGLGNNRRTLAKPFLKTHGTSIIKLQISGSLRLEDVRNIILTEAPNMEQLLLIESFSFVTSRNTFENSGLYDKRLPGPRPVLKNLKVFKCNNQIPKKFFRQILQYSPNLVEILAPTYCVHFLVNPVNRLRLLKKLVIKINKHTIKSLEIVANQHQDKFAVQELHFVLYEDEGGAELYRRAFDVMIKILKGCSATCQKVGWIATDKNFKIPKMPKVKQFTCHYNPLRDGVPKNIFSEGESLEDTFPQLKSFKIMSSYDIGNLPYKNIFGVNDPASVLTVQNVALCSSPTSPHENLVLRLGKMFPNAAICTDAKQRYEEFSYTMHY